MFRFSVITPPLWRIHIIQFLRSDLMFNYPDGVKMKNYKRTRVKLFRHRNKFHARKYYADGHKFDSKAEFIYYKYLKFHGESFRIHPKLTYRTRHVIKSRIDGELIHIRKRSYTPDFVITDKHDFGQPLTPKNPHIKEIDDVKGIKTPAYDNMKFDDFAEAWHMPITIVRIKDGYISKKTRGIKKTK